MSGSAPPGAFNCYYKPLRTNIRHFRCQDVARISRYAVRDGCEWLTLVGALAKLAGFEGALCDAARMVEPALALRRLMRPGTVIRVVAVLRFLLKALPRRLKPIAAALLLIFEALRSLQPEVEGVEEFMRRLCDEVRAYDPPPLTGLG